MLGYFGFGLYWIGNALLVENNPYWWAWPLAVSGLPIILGIFGALACYLHAQIFSKSAWPSYFGFIGLLAISEWARGNLFTGFPWNLFAYSWSGSPALMQSVSIINIYDLTALTIFWCSVAGYLFVAKDPKPVKTSIVALAGISLLGFYIFGQQRLANSQITYNQDYKVILVQPNVDQSQKWKVEKIIQNFEAMVKQSENTNSDTQATPKATYIIWPETSFTYSLITRWHGKDVISAMLRTYPENAYIIGGTLRHVPETDSYFNSIVLMDKSANTLDTYDKNHLVPFGEYMPLSSIIDIAPIVGFKGFETGKEYRTTKTPDGLGYFPLVCYEIIFPNLMTPQSATQADMVVNTTNDGWYGISAGPYQHLAQAQFRAIETGIPVIRVANTGFSAIIDPYGNIVKSTALFNKERIEAYLPSKLSIISKSNTQLLCSLLLLSLFTCICAIFERKISFTSDN